MPPFVINWSACTPNFDFDLDPKNGPYIGNKSIFIH